MSTAPTGELREALLRAVSAQRLLVASDYDGCMAPIVARPQDARPTPGSVSAVALLATLPDTAASVVSGRALADLRELSRLHDPVILVGSHGSEFDSGFAESVTDEDRARLHRVVHELRVIADSAPGATVEVKPVSAALHVRNAASAAASAALQRAHSGPAAWPGVHATEGKAVIELAVIQTSKGHAVDVLRDRTHADVVVYLGDDVTDEKAFARLRGDAAGGADVGIKVGGGHTAAEYRISGPDEVAAILGFLAAERRSQVAHPA